MRENKSKRLVIDASVAGASSDIHAREPVAKNCRNFLQSVLKICHHVVLTNEITGEWNKHQSTSARKWRVQMVSKGKVLIVDIPPNTQIRTGIKGKLSTDSALQYLEKDIILIEAALLTDKTIISLDDKAQKGFSEISQELKKLRSIVWVNPQENAEEKLSWLRDGANPVEKYKPGFVDQQGG